MIDSTLYVGEFDGLDAAAFLLLPQHIGPGGFSGSWRWDGGMEITVDSLTGREVVESGAFCAVRRPEAGA